MTPKPPLGLTPRLIHSAQRRVEIHNAIVRYLTAGVCIPPEWITEYNELITQKEDA